MLYCRRLRKFQRYSYPPPESKTIISKDKTSENSPQTEETPSPENPVNPTEDTALYTVSFNSNGGSEVASLKVTSGGTLEAPTDPTREGYTFAGWYKDENFTEIFTFGTDGDKITKDITLYAQWLDTDLLIAQYAVSGIVIGYSAGDNPNYVTGSLELPAKIESADISWSSSSQAISSNGTVTRQAQDTNVTLTATASYNGKSDTKTFNLKVIKKRTRINSEIQTLPLETASSGDLTVTRNDSGDVTDIEGNYVSFDIENADDAIDAVTVIKNELGIKNPIEELETSVINFRTTGTSYSFQQIYNGVKVYGRGVIASANSSSKGNFLTSNVVSSDLLEQLDIDAIITSTDAENSAKSYYSQEVEADPASEFVIYSLGSYDKEPVYAYIVKVYSTSLEELIVDSVFVNANNGEIITCSPNISYAQEIHEASGINEFGQEVNFVVERGLMNLEESLVTAVGTNKLTDLYTYFMRDPNLHVRMYYGNNALHIPIVGIYPLLRWNLNNPVYSFSNTWVDRAAVSTYTNMREIVQWWGKFGRNSLDNKGGWVDVIIHAPDDAIKDNASWVYQRKCIFVYDKKNNIYTCGADIDFMTHETTHGVIQYMLNSGSDIPLSEPVNEGYADVFACIKAEDWLWAEKLYENQFFDPVEKTQPVECDRNLRDPLNENSLTGWGVKTKQLDASEPHTAGLFGIGHAAYRMHEDCRGKDIGLTWDELGKVWYNSISLGLNTQSGFEDVRKCILRAADELIAAGELPEAKRIEIQKAFNEVGELYGGYTIVPIPGYNPVTPSLPGDISIDAEHFPDDFFRAYVKDNFDTDNNDMLSTEEIEKVTSIMLTPYLDPTNLITSLKGIEYFSALISLDCSFNLVEYTSLLTSLDVSQNKELQYLICNSNKITALDLRGNPKLLRLECMNNQITALDLTENKALKKLHCGYLQMSTLNLTNNTALEYLDCSSSSLTSLNVSKNLALKYLYCLDNQLTYLDVSNNTSLESLIVDRTLITNLDLSNNPALCWLGCNNCQLTSIDLSNNASLDVLMISENQLTILDVSKNPLLRDLYCDGNQLTTLDVSNHTHLEWLICENNPIVSLDMSGCTVYGGRGFSGTDFPLLEVLNAEGCISMSGLELEDLPLKELNIKGCTNLSRLYCDGTQLTALDVSEYTGLKRLSIYDSPLISLDASGCTALESLDCSGNQISSLNVEGCTAMYTLDCRSNQLSELDVSGCTALQSLSCEENQLTSLKLDGCSTLESLSCYKNQLTELNLNDCASLKSLLCTDNQITELDLRNCPNIESVQCDYWQVKVIYPSSGEKTSSALSTGSGSANNNALIVASLPAFTAEKTGEYIFDVSLDVTVSKDSRLILKNASENLSGVFIDDNGEEISMPLTKSLDHVRVSANFEALKNYSPVIAAQSEEISNNNVGGCNSIRNEDLGIRNVLILLLFVLGLSMTLKKVESRK